MSGDLITGKDGAAMGLVNHAVPREELRPYTMELARKLAAQMPYAVRATKVAVNRLLRRQVLEVMDACLAWEDLSMKMADHREAAAAFLERRSPTSPAGSREGACGSVPSAPTTGRHVGAVPSLHGGFPSVVPGSDLAVTPAGRGW
ncbi:MAG: enoyl-CoA hydratase-related protein [Dehalococcoidia bacterium]